MEAAMTFTWPWALVALVAVPALGVTLRRLRRARTARREALAGQGLVLAGSGGGGRRLGLVGPALVLSALALLVVALARPVAAIAEPRREGTVILAFDVSTSMAATDLQPTRLAVAQAAARRFVERQPASVRIGVVAFGATGVVAQRPTTDRTDVVAAIDRLRPQGQTSLGGGLLAALGAIAGRPVALPSDPAGSSGGRSGGSARVRGGVSGGGAGGAGASQPETSIGFYGGTAIVLLTDGEDTGGPDPLAAADLASTAGVRVDPVGLGTPQGTVLQIDGFEVATALDEQALRRIATTTGGTYRSANDAASLAAVYDSIELAWHVRVVPHEVTYLVAGLAALLLLAGVGTSVAREGRVI
jgi:Ca-activated chloride channel family protein